MADHDRPWQVWKCLNGTAPGYLSKLCVPVASSSGGQHLRSASTSFQGPNHDRPAELRCRGTISVEQSSCCSTETRDDSAHFQDTSEGLSVLHLMCWRTKGTFTTARRCCSNFVILAPDTKLQTYLLTFNCTSVLFAITHCNNSVLFLPEVALPVTVISPSTLSGSKPV